MLHYLLTGSARSREAVLQLADWVVAMDDGTKSKLRWIDTGDTGYASSTRSPDYHGPGRAREIDQRASRRASADARGSLPGKGGPSRALHSSLASPDALDSHAENRWSYTVFLQAIGKYLEHRAELGSWERRRDKARHCRIAAWMAEHEGPYLDHPERLEFRTRRGLRRISARRRFSNLPRVTRPTRPSERCTQRADGS
jgi:hypothetical protein